ncbi:Linear gramicidin synthase subunit D-like protein [Hapsidospora chrysogenum ATCC 11550]|uniref:Linear gramicidin synthase subunit D-like protein n=1 Tax=Hapsidospora chrysogenum (strain ATCC 11550 / CBS 779.69 / DSM 880 / IAM 14645 / JCM 23072 / IMI 49137) TaxID=857340 RepID=A0A086T865_HAPC1|nr:Linear gramicidin synthase subunit D-like protein [Hapsidospora chrysogenum ATCC 11550]
MAILDINKDLAAQFEQQAQATPSAIALEDENRTLTYAELDSETWNLADRLRRRGVGRDDLVGVLMGRSADYVIACLAALRAGGAFLVLELAYPSALLRDVIDDAKPTVVVTRLAHASHVKSDVPLIIMDDNKMTQEAAAAEDAAAPEIVARPPLPSDDDIERLAFVSYSSGTTGQPKGIANSHRAAVRSYDARFHLRDLQPGDRVACNVFFVWEMLRPLLRGATVFAVPDCASYDPTALADLLEKRRITDTLMTPTLLATVLSRHPNLGARLPDLESLWLNGEVVTTDLCRRAFEALPNTRILNVYSASETHEVAAGEISKFIDYSLPVCPVGPPVDPEHVYILDEAGNRVEAGVSGELYVGGDLLARGYLNLPETTAKAFQMDPFSKKKDARMYRTGDLARLLPSGLLEITGRVGGMIKTRGYTVQPAAVESAIVRHLAVRDCAVVAHGEGLSRQLVAYVVPDKDEVRGRTVLMIDESGYSPVARRALSAHLAHYMIPPLWVELDALPTHGVSAKIDLKALPRPSSPKSPVANGHREQNITIMMEAIVKIWGAALNISPAAITPKHDFFDLGGHSLVLADLANRFSQAFGFPVPVAPLAGNPTLEGHLNAIKAARDGHTAQVQADLPAVLRADCVLPDEIRAEGATFRKLSEADTVLLTGSTGYLGAFLLKSLLEETSAHILCMVRFTEPSEDCRPAGMARIRKNLVDLGIWDDSMLDRIEIVAGNLARKRLGLSPEAFDDLAARVQVVVHAAATVNLVYPYAALRNANVRGTREILRLASRSGATVHHISTNGVLPASVEGWDESAMLDIDDVPHRLLDGYGQTKWVAEKLVLEAGRSRGIPVRVYRPGTISGHSVTGATNAWDLLNALVVESLQLGAAPRVDGWFAEMTPVDFVTSGITTLCEHPGDGSQLVYHLGDPAPISSEKLFDALAELGYPTERVPWDEWVEMWREKRGHGHGDEPFTVDILKGGMPTEEGLKSVITLKDTATQPALDQYGLKRVKIDSRLLEVYTRHFYARGWLPRPPRRIQVNGTNGIAASKGAPVRRGRLAGKVAVVTGASSGIGAAVAAGLAREGANVAIAARRLDALESVRTRLASSSPGAKVLVHKTDVTKKDQVESLLKAAAEELGPVDVLVSCAGVMYYTMMANCQTDEWERTVDVNCKGLLNCLSSTVPGMLSRGSGHIVAISSDAGRKVFPGLGVYSASKFFVEATLQSLRLETVGSGLRVTSVQPGNTRTDLLGMSTDAEAIKKYGEPTGAQVLEPEDVASAIVYAVCQPAYVAVNEVMIEPRDEPI